MTWCVNSGENTIVHAWRGAEACFAFYVTDIGDEVREVHYHTSYSLYGNNTSANSV